MISLFKFVIVSCMGFTLLVSPVLAGGYRRPYAVLQKQVQVGNYVNVYAVPVTDLGLPYYYEVQSSRLTEEDINKVAEATANKTLEKFTSVLEGLLETDKSITNPTKPIEPDLILPPAEEPPQASDLDAKVLSIFQRSCITCHGNENKKGGLTLFAADKLDFTGDTDSDKLMRYRIHDAVSTNRMPKTGEPLPQDEVDAVADWMRSQATGKNGEVKNEPN